MKILEKDEFENVFGGVVFQPPAQLNKTVQPPKPYYNIPANGTPTYDTPLYNPPYTPPQRPYWNDYLLPINQP